MFFELSDKHGLKFIEEEIRMVPEFSALLDTPELGIKGFDFIVKCYRYNSPYRHLPDAQRIRICSEAVFKGKVNKATLNSKVMVDAVATFNELQFDADYEQYYAIENMSSEIARFIAETELTEESFDTLEKAGKTLKTYNEIKTSLKEIVFSRIEKGERATMSGKKKLSYMERFYSRPDVQKSSKAPAGVFADDKTRDSEP